MQTAILGQKKDFPNGIAECGTDALRFALCAYTSPGSDINLDIARVEGYRKFCNKIWNAAKFVIHKLQDNPMDYSTEPEGDLDLFTKWIRGRLSATAVNLDAYLADFNFLKATSTVHSFFLYDFCDVYVEVSKRLDSPTVYFTLFQCLLVSLKCLHPFMPYITEELYQRLYHATGTSLPAQSISLDTFPSATYEISESVESSVAFLMDFVKGLRIRSKEIKGGFIANVYAKEARQEELINTQKNAIVSLVKGLKVLKLGNSSVDMVSLEMSVDIMAQLEQLSI